MVKRLSRVLVMLLTATVVAGLQAPAASAKPTGTIRVVKPALPVWKGETAKLAGRFKHAHRRIFVIQRARPGSTTWRRVKGTRGRTTQRGRYHATVNPTRTLRYRALLRATRREPQRVSRAVKVGVSAGWLQASGGGQHTCAIRTDHSLWCWGWNYEGQLANDTNIQMLNPNPTPSRVLAPGQKQTWRSVSAGLTHTCAIRTDDTLWCWGRNGEGEAGDGTVAGATGPNPTPTQLIADGADQTWLSVSAGGFHTCGIRSDHTLWCWGANDSGQLGDPSDAALTIRPVPKQVLADGADQTWLSVSAGELHTCGIRSDHTLWCWGDSAAGELGFSNGYGSPEYSPVQVLADGADQTWISVVAGGLHTCGIRTDHTLWCWGINNYAQLGNSTNVGTMTPVPTPTEVLADGPDQSWLGGDTGHVVGCGIRPDQTLWCWGDNQWGELGTSTGAGTTDLTPAPTQVITAGDDQTWKTVATGDTHVCGLRFDQSLWCWGDNGNGQLGNPVYGSTSTPVPVVR